MPGKRPTYSVAGRLTALVLLAVAVRPAPADQPLHERIDAIVAAGFGEQQPAPVADDAAFLRRVQLDLAGTIPSAEDARQFIDDKAADKRTQLIDQLLAAPTYPKRMEELFHVMLLERRGEDEHWQRYLRASFDSNKPWDQLVRELLRPEDEDESQQGAGFFYTKRLESYGQNPVDYPGLTRDVGRLFLGVDLQCAECHDHLFIDDYKQRDFQGLFAVYKNLSISKGAKFPSVSEKAMTAKLDFVSVFDPTQQQTGPRIPFGEEFSIPEPPEKEEKKKDEQQQSEEARFSALALIAENLPSTESDLFARNIANRLWWIMMGRGLVEPLDQFHSTNPPSHPELLDLLAAEFVAHKFDVKWMLRELALTETYQRSSVLPEGMDAPPKPATYLVAHEKRLSAEQLLASTLEATGNAARFQPAEDGKPAEAFTELKAQFLAAFANEPREPEIEYNASVKAALFLLNNDKLLGLTEPQEGNLVERLAKMSDEKQTVDELFLSVFTRLPTDDERAAVLAFLKDNGDREAALGHVVWSMLSSMEFCVNH